MTTAASAPFRHDVFMRRGERTATPPRSLKRAWSDYRVYRRALAELRALSIRQREDVGIVGLDLGAVARAAAYGTDRAGTSPANRI